MTTQFENRSKKPRSCCSIVVTFNPNIETLLNLVRRIDEGTDLVLIDNNSANLNEFRLSVESLPRCKLFFCRETNLGLASALNIGIKWCIEHGYKFTFLFDQDSRLEELFFDNMVEAYLEIEREQEQKIAALGPRIINPKNFKRTRFKSFDRVFGGGDRSIGKQNTYFHADFIITSGSLLRLEYLSDIGLMKESYFIDNVDLEWCFRARKLGFKVIGTDSAHLLHAIGEKTNSFLVSSGIIFHHTPDRIYYSSRNRVHLWLVDYAPVGWKVRYIFRFVLKTVFLLVFSRERFEYGRNILKGLRAVKEIK